MGKYKFNPIVRSGFEQVDDGNSVIVMKDDGTEISVTEYFNQIVRQLGDKLDADSLPTYSIEVVDTEEGYLKTYQLLQSVKGVTTLLPHKINIPRDFFLRNVELVVVDDDHPIEGFDNGRYFKFTFVVEDGNERIQMLPVGDLAPCVDAGKHITIDDGMVSAHSFVPQYDDITKVLPEESIIQWKGENTEKFTHGYFYERQLVSKPVTEVKEYSLPKGTEYIDVLVDGYQLPKGRYYLLPDQVGPAEIRSGTTTFGTTYRDKEYQGAHSSILKAGDKIWTFGNYSENTEFLTIVEPVISNVGELVRVKVSDGRTLEVSGGGSNTYFDGIYVNADGIRLYSGNTRSNPMFIGTLREPLQGNTNVSAIYFDGLGYVPDTVYFGTSDADVDFSVTYTYGEQVYDWQRIDVQPRETTKTISEGTTEFWDVKNKTYVPQKGEIVIYTDYEQDGKGNNVPNIKIGDGNAYVVDLPYIGCDYLLKSHVSDKSIHHEIGLSLTDSECLIIN